MGESAMAATPMPAANKTGSRPGQPAFRLAAADLRVPVVVELPGFLLNLRLAPEQYPLRADDTAAPVVLRRGDDVLDVRKVAVAGGRVAVNHPVERAFEPLLALGLLRFLDGLLGALVFPEPPGVVGEWEIGG
jgi:hypothetical protein